MFWFTMRCRMSIYELLVMLFAVVFLWIVWAIPAQAADDTPTDCDGWQAVYNGEVAPWIGYPKGWDWPEDLQADGGFDFPDDGGVLFFYAPSQPDSEWVFVMLSYKATYKNGHLGQHDFCGPYRVSRAELKPILEAHPSLAGYQE